MFRGLKIFRDDGQVVIKVIPLSFVIQPIKIADALVLDEGGESPGHNGQEVRLHFLPFGL